MQRLPFPKNTPEPSELIVETTDPPDLPVDSLPEEPALDTRNEKPANLKSPKSHRWERLAQLIHEGKNRKQIAAELYPNVKNPAQLVYNAVKRKEFKAVYGRIYGSDASQLSESFLASNLQDIINNPESQRLRLAALELAFKYKGLLIERKQEVPSAIKISDLRNLPPGELDRLLIEKLKADSAGALSTLEVGTQGVVAKGEPA